MTLVKETSTSNINQEYRIKELKDILKYAIDLKVSIHQALKHKNRGKNFYNENIIKFNDNNELFELKKEYDELNLKVCNQYGNIETFNKTKLNSKSVDLNNNIKYDKRSTWWANRDDNGKIIDYGFKIMVRDEKDFCGTLSRSEMDSIYSQYPYTTQNNCSQLFPRFTFIEFKRLILCFQISKNKLLSLHSIEEESEEKLVELALKAKENSVYKKFITDKPIFIEKQLREVQKELITIQQNREWMEKTIEKYFNERKTDVNYYRFEKIEDSKNKKVGYCLFSDTHFGKCFDRPVFGRGYNKNIAHERIMEIAEKTIDYCKFNNIEKLIIGFFGDLIENFLEGGFHGGQVLKQDLHQDEQIFFAVDSFKECLLYIKNELPSLLIDFQVVMGNHDRSEIDRGDDKNRTPGKIAFKILQRELKGIIDITIPENNIINIKNDDIQLIGFHGDNNLVKRKSHELVNLYGSGNSAYHLIISGHYHRSRIECGTNYMEISLPSVCSTDEYILEDLGLNNLAGFILGKQNSRQKSFDYTYVNLY